MHSATSSLQLSIQCCCCCYYLCVQIWDLSSITVPSSNPATPIAPHLTVCTDASSILRWISPGLLATCGGSAGNYRHFHHHAESAKIELWDVTGKIKSRQGQATYDNGKIYNSQRVITCSATPTALSAANGVLVVGEASGNIQLFDAGLKGEGHGCLQQFTGDHKGAITDLYVVSAIWGGGRHYFLISVLYMYRTGSEFSRVLRISLSVCIAGRRVQKWSLLPAIVGVVRRRGLA